LPDEGLSSIIIKKQKRNIKTMTHIINKRRFKYLALTSLIVGLLGPLLVITPVLRASKKVVPIAIAANATNSTNNTTDLNDIDNGPGENNPINFGDQDGSYSCGDPSQKVIHTAIDFGCAHKGNAIIDLLFAIIRFLSIGVGLVVVGSIIVAGIQYTGSRGDPNATAQAIARIRNTLIALLIFIFAYAILNYIVPGTLLR